MCPPLVSYGNQQARAQGFSQGRGSFFSNIDLEKRVLFDNIQTKRLTEMIYWVTQKVPQICIAILRIRKLGRLRDLQYIFAVTYKAPSKCNLL